ncbi:MAG: DUF2637 domain-containing protein [Actinomycetota bacterium]|nr:DUF2637 domain-containing protein [Actinomycetota bacterium]
MSEGTTAPLGLRRIRRVSRAGVAALCLAGFTMSYGALHTLARDSGVPAALSWLRALVVDGFIVVASLSVLSEACVGNHRGAVARVLGWRDGRVLRRAPDAG